MENLSSQVSKLSISSSKKSSQRDSLIIASKESKNYITRSKVLIIMKGLPGSGKTTIAKKLSTVYSNSITCSADKYFEMKNKYKFDPGLLSEAHTYCKEAAIKGVKDQIPLIIIDNSNILNWEMDFYLKLAKVFNYIIFVIEPNTSWSKDVNILSSKNSHGVEISVLKKKKKSYENISPVYFGWFLNDADSFMILDIASNWLKTVMTVKEFKEDFRKRKNINSAAELIHHFSEGPTSLRDSRLLHCTSKYTAKASRDSLDQYMKRDVVTRWVGKVSTLSIVAYSVTPNTFGARLALTRDQLKVWGGDEDNFHLEEGKRKRFYPPNNVKFREVKIPAYAPDNRELRRRSMLRKVPQNAVALVNRRYSRGDKAHITLGTTKGAEPALTGTEIMNSFRKMEIKSSKIFKVPGGMLANFGNGSWGIFPDQQIVVDSIFSYSL